jgi:hypothetical protein
MGWVGLGWKRHGSEAKVGACVRMRTDAAGGTLSASSASGQRVRAYARRYIDEPNVSCTRTPIDACANGGGGGAIYARMGEGGELHHRARRSGTAVGRRRRTVDFDGVRRPAEMRLHLLRRFLHRSRNLTRAAPPRLTVRHSTYGLCRLTGQGRKRRKVRDYSQMPPSVQRRRCLRVRACVRACECASSCVGGCRGVSE